LPGRSFLPLLARDDPGWQRDWLYFSHVGNQALRVGDWKAVAAGTNGAWELYNLQRDREELRDLSKRYPDKLREMVKQWETLDKEFRQQAVSEDWPPVTAR
jgi:arylsulfatase